MELEERIDRGDRFCNLKIFGGTGLVILRAASLAESEQRVRLADRPRVNVGTSL